MTVHDIPALNASLNAVAATLLFFGRRAIKVGNRERHRKLMGAALMASVAFLSCYLYYHFTVQLVTAYQGTGLMRGVYFFILATHIPLAAGMVPFIIYAVVQALKGRFEKHRRIVRWVWPIWMYVSITGVLIYLMLYQL
jgi:putative membrane protein